jgi:maltodextrin utilization protein YvdJ
MQFLGCLLVWIFDSLHKCWGAKISFYATKRFAYWHSQFVRLFANLVCLSVCFVQSTSVHVSDFICGIFIPKAEANAFTMSVCIAFDHILVLCPAAWKRIEPVFFNKISFT